jgi:excisionase family DNA binding protein
MQVKGFGPRPSSTSPTSTVPRPVGKPQTPVLPEPYISKVETAKRLGKSVRCLDSWIKQGLIPFFKVGRNVLFKWSDVETHLSKTCRVFKSKL